MKHLILFSLFILSLPLMAQKHLNVIDDETGKPVAYAIIADSIGQIARTSLMGMAEVPKREGTIIIVHDSYDRLTCDYDSLPMVVRLHRREYTLDEVEVYGVKSEELNIHLKLLTQEDVADAKHKASGGNPFAWLSDRLFNAKERKRKAHLARLKKILDDY